jgi:hypothetical protein
MASNQTSPNETWAIPPLPYTQIPNVVLDYWIHRLKPTESRLLLLLCRETFGWHRESYEISLASMSRTMDLSLTIIKRALIALEDFGLIERERRQNDNGDYKKTRYRLKIKPVETGGGRQLQLPTPRQLQLPTREINKRNKKSALPSGRAENAPESAAEKAPAFPARPPAVVPPEQPQTPTAKPCPVGEKPVPPMENPIPPPVEEVFHPGEIPSPTEEPTPAWHAKLRAWLEANCPVHTRLDNVMFSRIAGFLSLALLPAFYVAAATVEKPRKWAIYAHVAREVAERGEAKCPPTRKEAKQARREEWKRQWVERLSKEAS